MRAFAVFPSKREGRIIEHEAPVITSPTQVKVKVLEAGICGTDREICAFEYGTPPPGSEYLILGHESLAEVLEVGADVTLVSPGDLVVPMVRRPCPHQECLACRMDRQDFCDTGDFSERGIKGLHGFMCEQVVDDEKYMIPVPADLRGEGILVEPLTIAEKALAQVWQIQTRLPWACPVQPGKAPGHCHCAVVLGAGPVGILGAMALAASGFQTMVYSREAEDSHKARLLSSLGATYVSAGTDSLEDLAARVDNVDLVYEATGASRLSFEFMKYLGTNGVFIFTGVPGRKAPIEFDSDFIMRNLVLKNQVVYGTVNAGRGDYEAAIRDLALFKRRWPGKIRALITGRHSLDDIHGLVFGDPGGIKHVVDLSKGEQS